MNNKDNSVPRVSLQSPAVDFVDNHLRHEHRLFDNDTVRFDPDSRRYIARHTQSNMGLLRRKERPPGPANPAPVSASAPGPTPTRPAPATPPGPGPAPASPGAKRQEPPGLQVPTPLKNKINRSVTRMTFWDSMFPEAMDALAETPEPEKRSGTLYHIREERSWDAVYDKLCAARAKYTKSSGLGGKLKSVRRKLADNVQIVAGIMRFIPDLDYVTPVLGVVEIMLDAVNTAALARQEALAFCDMESNFVQIELFFVLWPKEDSVRNASVALLAAVLLAIESAIGFFIKSAWAKAGKAIFLQDEYEKELRDCIGAIGTSLSSLKDEGQKSQTKETVLAAREVMKYSTALAEFRDNMNQLFDALEKSQEKMEGRLVEKITDGKNGMLDVLNDFVAELRQNVAEYRENIAQEKAKNARLEAQLSQILLHVTTPAPTQPPSPALYPVEPDGHDAPANSLRPHLLTIEEILDELAELGITNQDIADMERIKTRRAFMPRQDLARAEQMVATVKFRAFLTSPRSSKLLVHGDFQNGPQSTSPLSVLSCTLTEALRSKEGFVVLTWFCGRHTDADESAVVGGQAMVLSFIAQLLRQCCGGGGGGGTDNDRSRELAGLLNLTLPALEAARSNLSSMCKAFRYLVQKLVFSSTKTTTVLCIIDGISYYERQEFEDDMANALVYLLRTLVDGDDDGTNKDNFGGPVVKILVTSPYETSLVRLAFEDDGKNEAGDGNGERSGDDLILSLRAMPRLTQVSVGITGSRMRIERELS